MDVIDSTGTPATTPPSPAEPPPPPRPSGGWRSGWTFAAVGLAVVLALVAFSLGRMSAGDDAALDGPTTTTIAPDAQTAPPATLAAGEEPVAAVAAALTPSIVQIQTDLGLGSGVIYDADGLILTAAHVVGSTQQVIVQLADGSKVDGTVVGADSTSDVAVVRIDAPGLVPAPLALDEALQPGQMAIAIGSPFGLDQTVTSGVISSASRALPDADGLVRELIQTDAPINPGNSGGALADRQGRVIGINDQIFSRSGGNEGVGFAIPIADAKQIADKLVAGEPIETPVLGVTGTDPTIGAAGALITAVQSDSPADIAGMAAGDLVVAIDGSPVQSFLDLAAAIRSHEPGDTVVLTIERSGSSQEVTAVLGTR